LLYPHIANAAFSAFSCYPAFDDGREYLIADVNVDCWTSDYYSSMFPLAWAAVGLYAFGLLALNGALLFTARHAILAQTPTPLSQAIGFLYRELKPWAFWWEVRPPTELGTFVMGET
jgi:hypothetical protein